MFDERTRPLRCGLLLGVFAVAVRIWLTPFLSDRTYITFLHRDVRSPIFWAGGRFDRDDVRVGNLASPAPPRGTLDRSEIFGLTHSSFSGAIIARRASDDHCKAEIELYCEKASLVSRLEHEMQNEMSGTAEVNENSGNHGAPGCSTWPMTIFVRTANDQISTE
jgi:hypothetical protein